MRDTWFEQIHRVTTMWSIDQVHSPQSCPWTSRFTRVVWVHTIYFWRLIKMHCRVAKCIWMWSRKGYKGLESQWQVRHSIFLFSPYPPPPPPPPQGWWIFVFFFFKEEGKVCTLQSFFKGGQQKKNQPFVLHSSKGADKKIKGLDFCNP